MISHIVVSALKVALERTKASPYTVAVLEHEHYWRTPSGRWRSRRECHYRWPELQATQRGAAWTMLPEYVMSQSPPGIDLMSDEPGE